MQYFGVAIAIRLQLVQISDSQRMHSWSPAGGIKRCATTAGAELDAEPDEDAADIAAATDLVK